MFACELDTASLPEEEAVLATSLVDLEELDRVGRVNPIASDAIQYEITVESDGVVRSVRFDDLTVPHSMLPLLSYLRSRAKPCLSSPGEQ